MLLKAKKQTCVVQINVMREAREKTKKKRTSDEKQKKENKLMDRKRLCLFSANESGFEVVFFLDLCFFSVFQMVLSWHTNVCL